MVAPQVWALAAGRCPRVYRGIANGAPGHRRTGVPGRTQPDPWRLESAILGSASVAVGVGIVACLLLPINVGI